jgi:hypothetical protein
MYTVGTREHEEELDDGGLVLGFEGSERDNMEVLH